MFTGTSLFKNNIYYNIIYVFSRRIVECNIIKGRRLDFHECSLFYCTDSIEKLGTLFQAKEHKFTVNFIRIIVQINDILLAKCRQRN